MGQGAAGEDSRSECWLFIGIEVDTDHAGGDDSRDDEDDNRFVEPRDVGCAANRPCNAWASVLPRPPTASTRETTGAQSSAARPRLRSPMDGLAPLGFGEAPFVMQRRSATAFLFEKFSNGVVSG